MMAAAPPVLLDPAAPLFFSSAAMLYPQPSVRDFFVQIPSSFPPALSQFLPASDARLTVSSTIANVLQVAACYDAAEAATLNHQFQGQHMPSISLQDYAERLIRYVDSWAGEAQGQRTTGVSCALVALIYISRIPANFVTVSDRTVHRLFLAAMLCAVKFTEDFRITNRFWAKVGGIDLEEMNRLEIDFLRVVQWNLRISEEEFSVRQKHFGL